ncbi:hypothetical protein [Pseudoxanthomonas sacheonensis]|uniref:Pimeloyl-ACP methyl ester carboxylesterase n=1 Tax=Pseudoxanthomonas sacheonensis TaxID=443615 RepID=A0ABU1RR47_9GAMM|nr:hypothetical protein [Pseudoxanthomonas sacheonensis]MDR6840589.1 pimeloyl-ACP methyl ester carboxylesterase [Pseudoxanthomonas sacheonensis]
MIWTKKSRITALTLAFGLIAGCGSAPPAAQRTPTQSRLPVVDSGTLDNAPYRVDIPANWNGGLVMLLHGYEPKGVPRTTPWPQNEAAPIFLSQGYAVAASAYASQGWSVADAVPDNERLRSYFEGKYGDSRRTYLVGFSLGGHIALASLENYGSLYDGALSLCGVNTPAASAFNDAVLPSLVAFDYFFPGVMGLASGGLSDPASPAMLDPEAIESALKANEQAAGILSRRLEIARAALPGALMLNYMVLREMQARTGGFPADNRATVYSGFGDDAAFNKAVRRYSGDQNAMKYLADHADLTGRVGKPLVLQSNNDDPTIPKRLTTIYPALAAAAGRSDRVVVLPSAGEGHCGFAPEQIRSAFETLISWVDSGYRPAGP